MDKVSIPPIVYRAAANFLISRRGSSPMMCCSDAQRWASTILETTHKAT